MTQKQIEIKNNHKFTVDTVVDLGSKTFKITLPDNEHLLVDGKWVSRPRCKDIFETDDLKLKIVVDSVNKEKKPHEITVRLACANMRDVKDGDVFFNFWSMLYEFQNYKKNISKRLKESGKISSLIRGVKAN